jgi:hypothetical protein
MRPSRLKGFLEVMTAGEEAPDPMKWERREILAVAVHLYHENRRLSWRIVKLKHTYWKISERIHAALRKCNRRPAPQAPALKSECSNG